ncbi:MAG TPA: CPBP family intramembrane glutamic endopeptidase [Tepidisphaeraceae bacterium]|nr:CPBP family intramembrane glutamic endopeptidase [Tepidisphaeraceae bacterium]
MSILGNIANLFRSADVDVVLGATLLISLPLAVVVGMYRPRAIAGPPRLAGDRSAFSLAVALFIGFLVMIVVGIGYNMMRHPSAIGKPPATLDIVDQAFLFSVPGIACAAALILADHFFGGRGFLTGLGLNLGKFPGGIAWGVLGALILVPPTYAVSILVEFIYQHVSFSHPTEHELLTLLHTHSPHPMARVVLVLAATLIAPFYEELLFRGHLQTLLKRMIIVFTTPAPPRTALIPGYGFPVLQPGIAANFAPAGAPVDPPLANVPPDAMAANPPPIAAPTPPVPAPRRVWQSWLAVLITSCLFAAMHEPWMWPPIFFLSLGLGYWYERTGNLWTNVTIHCLFNSISTFAFLISTHP